MNYDRVIDFAKRTRFLGMIGGNILVISLLTIQFTLDIICGLIIVDLLWVWMCRQDFKDFVRGN